jgi:hypothetical protein
VSTNLGHREQGRVETEIGAAGEDLVDRIEKEQDQELNPISLLHCT